MAINKELEVENLKGESLVAQRLICDHITAVGDIMKVELSKLLLVSAAAARQRYSLHLEDLAKQKRGEEESRKRKAALDDIAAAKRRKDRLEKDVTELLSSANDFAEKAERTGKLTWITKSNSLWRTAKQKQGEIQELDNDLREKVDALPQ